MPASHQNEIDFKTLAMDVLCVFNSDGKPHCTEFYIKFKSPLVDEIAVSALGLHDEAGPSDQLFPETDYNRIIEAAQLAHQLGHPTHRSERVQITCNGHICSNVIACVGEEQLVHFYDPEEGVYTRTPSSNVLRNFELKLGKNIVNCIHLGSNLFREFNIWRYELGQRLVIMDIDGTITKSDVTGYIQTVYLGMFSYIHDGIVPFLNALTESHGYAILYLTARPLGHQRETKQLLERVSDSTGRHLPEGPLFPSKDRMLAALYREVVSKTTMQMKTAVLVAISRVFARAGSTKRTPFALGIGNKEADALAYNLAGLNAEHILLIDKSSRIDVWKHMSLAKLRPQQQQQHLKPEQGQLVGCAEESLNNSELRRSRSADGSSVARPHLQLLKASLSSDGRGLDPFTDSSGEASPSPGAPTPGTAAGAVVSTSSGALCDSAAVYGEEELGEDKGLLFPGSDGATAVSERSSASARLGGSSSGSGSGGVGASMGGVFSSVRRAFSHGISEQSSGSCTGRYKQCDGDNLTGTDHIKSGNREGYNGNNSSISSSNSVRGGKVYTFQTYSDPQLLQYITSISHIS